jgi:hypothetical protein
MLYIQVDVTLIDHPKTKKLARLLGVNRMTTVGHLVALWSWAAQYAPDGDLTNYKAEPGSLADGAQWEGDAALFMSSLIDSKIGGGCGFLEDVNGRLMLHDWADYFGKLIERREADAQRQREKRERERLAAEQAAAAATAEAERLRTLQDAPKDIPSTPADVRVTSDGQPTDSPRISSVNVAQRSVAQNSESEGAVDDFPPDRISQSTVKTIAPKYNPKLSEGVNMFARVTGKTPNRQVHDYIDGIVSQRKDEAFMRQCFEQWLIRGFRSENIGWLKDWYLSGAIPTRNGNGNGHTPAPTPTGTIDMTHISVPTGDPFKDYGK